MTGFYTCAELGQEYNKDKSTIRLLLKRNNIERRPQSDINRKYKFNQHYFDIIDNEHKAYWLGFLYADGCNYRNNNEYVIHLALKIDDIKILQNFLIDLESDKPINIYTRKDNRTYCQLAFNCKYFSDSLLLLGLLQRKSFILGFPTEKQVPKYLLSHFMRGYLDGDGWICYKEEHDKIKYCRFGVTSSYEFCDRAKAVIEEQLQIKLTDIYTNGSIFKIEIGGRKKCKQILDWIYKDATIWLDRKYEKYQLIKNSPDPKQYNYKAKI